MKKVTIILLVLSMGIYLSSCTTKIDGSSQDKLETSLQDITSNLEGKKKGRFNQSIMLYLFENTDMFQLSSEILEGKNSPIDEVNQLNYPILKELDGLTAEEVISKGRIIAKKKVDSLTQKKKKAKEHEEKLKKFRIKAANIYTREGYLENEKFFELTVKNETNYPVSRVYFNGIYQNPERSVPYNEEEFNYEIPGGLEPGEETTWNLRPNMMSDWSDIEIREDANFKVEVLRLDGAEGNKLYSKDIFEEKDKKLLSKLIEIFPGLK